MPYPPLFKIIPYLILFFNITLIVYQFRKYFQRSSSLKRRLQNLQEKINILVRENALATKSAIAWEDKIKRYTSLKEIIEKLNRNLNLDSLADSLTQITFTTIAKQKGAAILYRVNKQLNLEMFKTKKEDKDLVLKAKQGDIFDFWVLRHNSPLLVEDTRNDFRFDLNKLEPQNKRSFLSLVSSPVVSEHRFFGTLRIDNPQPNFYTQDDLRFLVTIAELGGTALENSELFQRIQDLGIRDSLCGLYTKGYFLERLQELSSSALRKKAVLTLVMLDIDFFKDYNDKFGHTAGDIVLKRLSANISGFLKETDAIVSRFGGEEFCIAIMDKDKETLSRLAEGLRQNIEQDKIILRRQETKITVSIGIAAFPEDASDIDTLIQKADMAMYKAKAKGKNRVCLAG